MTSHITAPCLSQPEIETAEQLFDNWSDPIEAGLRERTREFLQAMLEAELEASHAWLSLHLDHRWRRKPFASLIGQRLR